MKIDTKLRVLGTLLAIFIGITSAQAETARALFDRCAKTAGEDDLATRKCILKGIDDDPQGLKRNLFSYQTDLQAVASGKKTADPSCRMPRLKFTKSGDKITMNGCYSDGRCSPLQAPLSIEIDSKQRDEIILQLLPKKNSIFVNLDSSKVNESCQTPGKLCHQLYRKVLGFDPSADMTSGYLGTKVEYNPANATMVGQGTTSTYTITRQIQVVAPAEAYKQRLPSLFLGRGTSVLAKIIDHNRPDDYYERLVFNIYQAKVLADRVGQLGKNGQNDFMFTFIGSAGGCADPILQQNDVRRGINIFESMLYRQKDRSGELDRVIGNSLKGVGTGLISTVGKGFISSQINDATSASGAEKSQTGQ